MKTSPCVLSILILMAAIPTAAHANGSFSTQAKAIMDQPDIVFSESYLLPASPRVLERAIGEPLILLRLWEAYGFSPRYKAYPLSAESFHVDDPTGIMGDIYPAEGGEAFPQGSPEGARVYLAFGKLNHRLVPAFRGTAVAVFTPLPEGEAAGSAGAGASAGAPCAKLRVDMYLRMENRFIGFLARAFFPILRSHVVIRLDSNVKDMGTILGDLSTAPRETAARLDGEDAAKVLEAFAQR